VVDDENEEFAIRSPGRSEPALGTGLGVLLVSGLVVDEVDAGAGNLDETEFVVVFGFPSGVTNEYEC
jgi:hypothetical protein